MKQKGHNQTHKNVIQANNTTKDMKNLTQTQTLDQLAEYYGIHPVTLRRWLRAEHLPLPRDHRRNVYTPAELALIHKTLG